jgi:hypothetical protein
MLRPTVSRSVCLGVKHSSGALSDERTGLSFTIAAGPRQRSQFRFRVPLDSRPYFTDTDSRLTFSSPSTTRRSTMEVFEPASTRESDFNFSFFSISNAYRVVNTFPISVQLLLSGGIKYSSVACAASARTTKKTPPLCCCLRSVT